MKKRPKTIPLKIAIKWTECWRKVQGTFNKHHEIRAFLIPMDDLKAIMKEPGVANVRAYLGVDEADPEKPIEKLLLVGVRKDGTDIIYRKPVHGDGDVIDDGIFDFTEPCPPECDSTSPLN